MRASNGLRFSGGPNRPGITQQNATTGARRKMDRESRLAPANTYKQDKAGRCKRLLCSLQGARLICMTRSLDSVMKTLASLPAEEQDRIAQWLSAELASERRWTDMFDKSQDLLAEMADEALADLDAGRTTELDPEKL
jgi:hypothetical protein